TLTRLLLLRRELTPACAASLTALKFLNLQSDWTRSTLHHLPALSRLESFTGWGRQRTTLVPDIELHPLAQCQCLTSLELHNIQLPPSGLTFLTALCHLQRLELWSCVGVTPAELGRMTALRELEVIKLGGSRGGLHLPLAFLTLTCELQASR